MGRKHTHTHTNYNALRLFMAILICPSKLDDLPRSRIETVPGLSFGVACSYAVCCIDINMALSASFRVSHRDLLPLVKVKARTTTTTLDWCTCFTLKPTLDRSERRLVCTRAHKYIVKDSCSSILDQLIHSEEAEQLTCFRAYTCTV